MDRSRELIDRLVKAFWDGSKWIAFNASSGQRSDNINIALYMPLLLGDRLPREIIDRSIETMFAENGFYTPYGLRIPVFLLKYNITRKIIDKSALSGKAKFFSKVGMYMSYNLEFHKSTL